MSGIINRPPVGLLSALDMKSRGNAPRELSPVVGGSIELRDLYELNRYVSATANTSISISSAGFFGTSTLNVPENQVWRLLHVSLQLTVAVGTTYRLAPAIRRRSAAGGALLDFALTDPQTYTAGEVVAAGWEGSVWLNPGDGPAVACSNVILGTAGAPSVRICYVPYEI